METTKNQTFRALHERGFVLPNAWDHASGALLAEAGFPAVGTTSLGVAAVAGKPDAAGAIRDETLALARSLARLPVPVTVDVEGGYSDEPAQVAELAAELASLGIAGLNLEDSHADGSPRAPEHHASLVAAARKAAPDLFLNARTDAFWLSERPDLDAALHRARLYAEAGADGIFVPGAGDDRHVTALVEGIDLPLNLLHLPGVTEPARLFDLGVRRVSSGSLLYRTALGAAVSAALALTGAGGDRPVPTYQDVQRLL
ncbi:isocitrate lyase/PEP mutase family protein [Spirillospora sp. CA-294931]|uniref:isocitrate lyase/PEP mutase family protein n=1 Tax=Spirillospora sp. CA-294931 TaxID=3240042 RepID=UPI003D9369CF